MGAFVGSIEGMAFAPFLTSARRQLPPTATPSPPGRAAIAAMAVAALLLTTSFFSGRRVTLSSVAAPPALPLNLPREQLARTLVDSLEKRVAGRRASLREPTSPDSARRTAAPAARASAL